LKIFGSFCLRIALYGRNGTVKDVMKKRFYTIDPYGLFGTATEDPLWTPTRRFEMVTPPLGNASQPSKNHPNQPGIYFLNAPQYYIL